MQLTRTRHNGPVHLSARSLRWVCAGLLAIVILVALPFSRPRLFAVYTPTTLQTAPGTKGIFQPEIDDRGNQFVWTAPSALIDFSLVGTKPVYLQIALRNAAIARGPDAPVHVLVDDREVSQLHPAPDNGAFQTFRVQLPHRGDAMLHLMLRTDPFLPGRGDTRTLGTMVKSVEIDKSAAWSSIRGRFWLYWLVPIFGVLAAVLLWAAQSGDRSLPSTVWTVRAGYGAVAACLSGAACMLVAVSLLLRMGRIDLDRYELWLFGSLYLGVFLAAVAFHLPFGGPNSPTLWQRLTGSAFTARRPMLLVQGGNALLLGVTTLAALHFLHSPGTGDVQDKLVWMRNLASNGLVGGFRVSADNYPPGSFVILLLITKIAAPLSMGFFLAYKLSLVVFLFLSGLVVMIWTKNAVLLVAMQCALILDSSVLGYNDVYVVPTLLLALWALHARKPAWFSALFTITLLIKWQPVIIAPVLFLAVLLAHRDEKSPRDLRRIIAALILPCGTIVFATLLLFGAAFIDAFRAALSEHWLSANALNANWVLTRILHGHGVLAPGDAATSHKRYVFVTGWPLLLATKAAFAMVYLAVLYRFIRSRKTDDEVLYYAYVCYFAYFLLNTSVHENHLIPAVILAGVLWWRDASYAWVFVTTTVITNVNLYLFYGLDGVLRLPLSVHGLDMTVVLALCVVGVFIALLVRGPPSVRERVHYAPRAPDSLVATVR
ncbi:MAG: hypothetical protein ACR2JW_08025 [Thermomicrobiales bacterium]